MKKLILSALFCASCLPQQKNLHAPTPYTTNQNPTLLIASSKTTVGATIDASPSLIALTQEGVIWAGEVLDFTSEWHPTEWSTGQLLGPPDVFPMKSTDPREWSDSPKSWAAREKDNNYEILTLGFGLPIDAKGIVVAETHSPGGVVKVENADTGEVLWEGKSPTVNSQSVEMMRITFSAPQKIQNVRLTIDTNKRDYWEEIDAVGLLLNWTPTPEQLNFALNELEKKRFVEPVYEPDPPVYQPQSPTADEGEDVLKSLEKRQVVWANGVRDFSSEWSPDSWSANQSLGAPDLFPRCADEGKAWAATDADKGTEYLSLSFPSTKAKAIIIAESLTPGGVIKIEDISNPGAPVVIWKGDPQKVTEKCRIVELAITPRELRAVRITINTATQPYWEEIDAVGLLPAK